MLDSDLYLLISVDLPVAKDDSVNNSDTPKGFSRLLKFREMATKRQQEKREAKKNTNNESTPSTVRSLGRRYYGLQLTIPLLTVE